MSRVQAYADRLLSRASVPRPPLKQHLIEGNADERNHLGPKPFDLPAERLLAGRVVSRLEIADPPARSCHEIRQAVAPLRKPDVLLARQGNGDEAGFMKQLPEPVRITRIVTADRYR